MTDILDAIKRRAVKREDDKKGENDGPGGDAGLHVSAMLRRPAGRVKRGETITTAPGRRRPESRWLRHRSRSCRTRNPRNASRIRCKPTSRRADAGWSGR